MRSLYAIMALTLALAGAGPVLAQTAPQQPDAAQGDTAEIEAGTPLALDDLAAVSGQGVENTLLSEQQLSAASSGNSITANTVRSGDVSMAGALSGFSGVGNFVVNTGNNNTLQGAISVNIITTPAL